MVHNAALSSGDRLVFDAVESGVQLRAEVLVGDPPCVIVEVTS